LLKIVEVAVRLCRFLFFREYSSVIIIVRGGMKSINSIILASVVCSNIYAMDAVRGALSYVFCCRCHCCTERNENELDIYKSVPTKIVVRALPMSPYYQTEFLNLAGDQSSSTKAGEQLDKMERFLKGPCVDINAQDPVDGRTALHKAALNGRADIVALLLRYKADATKLDNNNHTPKYLARNESITGLFEKVDDDEKMYPVA
jgi:hypothetical protein